MLSHVHDNVNQTWILVILECFCPLSLLSVLLAPVFILFAALGLDWVLQL